MKRAPADTELFRGGGHVSIRRRQGLQNQFALGLVEVEQ